MMMMRGLEWSSDQGKSEFACRFNLNELPPPQVALQQESPPEAKPGARDGGEKPKKKPDAQQLLQLTRQLARKSSAEWPANTVLGKGTFGTAVLVAPGTVLKLPNKSGGDK